MTKVKTFVEQTNISNQVGGGTHDLLKVKDVSNSIHCSPMAVDAPLLMQLPLSSTLSLCTASISSMTELKSLPSYSIWVLDVGARVSGH